MPELLRVASFFADFLLPPVVTPLFRTPDFLSPIFLVVLQSGSYLKANVYSIIIKLLKRAGRCQLVKVPSFPAVSCCLLYSCLCCFILFSLHALHAVLVGEKRPGLKTREVTKPV